MNTTPDDHDFYTSAPITGLDIDPEHQGLLTHKQDAGKP
jgi:hypothetical protein